jgi:YesN/AraC family two-component response regulator
MYEYQYDGKAYEKYRDDSLKFDIKRHEVKSYYSHFHYAVELCYVIKGSFEYSVNGQKGRASQGDIVFIKSGEMHEYYESENCEVYVMIMSELYSADYAMEFSGTSFATLLDNKEVNKKVKKLLDEGFKTWKNNYFLENKILANRLYSILKRGYPETERVKRGLFLNKILEYIYSHYKENLTLERLAEEFSYSPVAVAKLFQKEIKVDFRVFVNNVRAEMVNKKMKDAQYKDWPLAQIVMECGFVSLATFYRSYKRSFGHAPDRIHN